MSELLLVESTRRGKLPKVGKQQKLGALASEPPVVAPRIRPAFRPDLIDADRFLVDPSRPYPEWPLICAYAHLPAFETEAEAIKWNNDHGHLPILAKWTCSHCWMIHYWSTSATDSNGAYAAGAGEIPQRIKELMK